MKKLKTSFLNELRRLLTDPASRGTSTTDEFNGDGSTKTFALTNYNLMFVSSVTVDGVTKKLISDFEIDFGSGSDYGTIIFGTAPPSGTNNVDVTYTYGENWVYDDQPHVAANMPRVSVLNVGGAQETSGGVGDKVVFIYPTFRVGIWVRTGKSYTIGGYKYTGSKLLDYMVSDLQDAIHSIRDNSTIGNLVDINISPPVYPGLDEEYKLKRAESTVTTFFKKSYS